MSEYKLKYTAQEIDERLEKVDRIDELDGKFVESITTDENNNVIVTYSNGSSQIIGQLNIDVQADFLTSGGFGNLRFTDNKFQYYDEATSQWVDTQMTSENVTILNLTPQPMQTFSANFNPDTGNVELYINESADTIIDGQTASTVEEVIIRRKKDTFPIDENDGDLVIITKRKNFGAYKNTPYIDVVEGIEIGDTYYYKAFPKNNVGMVGYSSSNESQITTRDYWLYGFKLDQNESDPASMITYIEDNEDYKSAYMDYALNEFNYGSWENAWFMKVKPCMLNYDGTVAYYLDPNNYALKEDGTESDITDNSFDGNAMVGIPKTYWKIVDNGDNTANIYFSNKKVDDDFACWSHIDNNGNEIDYCYMPIYNGYSDGTRLRSLSGKTPMYNKTASAEITLAKANNQDDDNIWNMEVYSDRTLINLLLLLIGKSTNTQSVFGNGYYTGGSSSSKSRISTGTMNTYGPFWGKNGSTMVGVKVFGMEHWWGNQYRRLLGIMNDKGNISVKLTYGQHDGSTTDGYNTTCAGYIPTGCTPSGTTGGFISKMSFTKYGLIPTVASGSASTYYADAFFFVNTITQIGIVSGASGSDYNVGAFCCSFNDAASAANWHSGASISCKPFAPIEEVE